MLLIMNPNNADDTVAYKFILILINYMIHL